MNGNCIQIKWLAGRCMDGKPIAIFEVNLYSFMEMFVSHAI
jgi:hypothetical protein